MPRRPPRAPQPPELRDAGGTSASPFPIAPCGTLYVLATPIGNPDDLAPRAANVLRRAALVVAEDSRVARPLLERVGSQSTLLSLRPRGAESAEDSARSVLQGGGDVALIADAGTPLVADPGLSLVRVALKLGAEVRAVPGANAALAALVISGFPAGRFAFDGCPPRSRTDRYTFFEAIRRETRTLLLHESRAGLRATLRDLLRVCGSSRLICLACDLTRPSESHFRGTLAEALDWSAPQPPHGEYVLVIAPPAPSKSQ